MEQEKNLEKELYIIYNIQKECIILERVNALVDWDQKVCMPEEGIGDCSEKLSLVSKLAHEKFTSKELKDSLEYLTKPEVFEKLNDKEQTVVKRLYKDVEKASKLPTEFVEEFSKVASNATAVWQEAKKEKNFEKFRPHLEKIVELKKEEAKLISLPGHPYNSLLDDYEEGMTVDKLQLTFEFLGKELTQLLKKIVSTEVYKKQSEELFKKKFSHKKQEKLSHIITQIMGLPEDRTRLDVSMHPFTTTIGQKDVRITTRYIDNPLDSFGSTIHEGGHALYELGLPEEYENTVIRAAPSLGIHESQSRFWENMIGKSESFWKQFYPKFKETFKRQLKDISFDEWYRLANIVKPSYIRIEADELTYCLHIILRYEMEKGLIEGNIQVKDLPQVWNDRFEQMFGIRPRHDSEGVLQDVHWSGGSIGYFPTYALGTIYSAQLYNQLVKENPGITKEIEHGKLENIVSWLRDKVHKYGRSLTADEIITKVCGEGLNPEAYIKYLHDKYSKLYKT